MELGKNKNVAINAFNLTKKFGDFTAVDKISFKIFEGEIVGILGPNGAGKTTTLRLLTGVFELEDEGKIEIFNEDFSKNLMKCKSQFGIVPEISNAYLDYTVMQNLRFSGKLYGISSKGIDKRSKELLERFELNDKINSKTKTLSKGLKQRLNLCLALLHEPSILILDEPTSGLDPFSVKIMREQILQLQNEGKTILITTHDMLEAQNICDRILIMNKGKIIADENPDTLRKNFKSLSSILFKIEKGLSPELKNELIRNFPDLTLTPSGFYSFTSANILKDLSELYTHSNQNKIEISDLKLKDTSLEEVFIDLIKTSSNSKEESKK